MKTKRTLLILLIGIFLLPLQLLAQESAGRASYEKGDKILHAGISAGSYGYGYYGNRSGLTVPLSFSAELGFHDFLSVGPYLGFARWKYDYQSSDYSWTFFSIGGRISAHYLPFINEWWGWNIDESKFDFYLTGLLGLEFRSWQSDYEDQLADPYDNEVHLVIGPILGFKYMLNESWGLFFEGGRGALGYGTFGASVRF
jgi:hypothetical protein